MSAKEDTAQTPVADSASAFDPERFARERAECVKASREAGHVHLDMVPPYVETMRGKAIEYVHDPRVKGVIRTVANTGEVVVHWSDDYSAGRELACAFIEGGRRVWRSWLAPADLKDYRFQPRD